MARRSEIGTRQIFRDRTFFGHWRSQCQVGPQRFSQAAIEVDRVAQSAGATLPHETSTVGGVEAAIVQKKSLTTPLAE